MVLLYLFFGTLIDVQTFEAIEDCKDFRAAVLTRKSECLKQGEPNHLLYLDKIGMAAFNDYKKWESEQ